MTIRLHDPADPRIEEPGSEICWRRCGPSLATARA